MSKPVILLGGGGHARVLLDMLRRLEIEILGMADPHRLPGSEHFGVKILGDDSAIRAYAANDIALVNGIGSLPRGAGLRGNLYEQFVKQGYVFQTLVDPRAFTAGGVQLAQGVQVMAGAIIQAGTKIAENCIVNSGAIVEHDCRIGRDVHIAPGAVLSGGVELGNNVHIGTGATIIQGLRIGSGSVVGAGSVVTRDIGCKQIVYPPRSHIQDL
ncbi:acetyltransferase [Methylomonas sp. MO1]|uniref:acetyltransferase n=1 Tax=unclassified Methylomonas TaxID=2608980 RepID=UPI000479C4D3|nr:MULTISPECIES: acetyltransferase [unclassified Methylomonas]MDT4288731.1 acetyltransferase [Methylomonas sp. MO1]